MQLRFSRLQYDSKCSGKINPSGFDVVEVVAVVEIVEVIEVLALESCGYMSKYNLLAQEVDIGAVDTIVTDDAVGSGN